MSTVLKEQDNYLSNFELFEKDGELRGPRWVRAIRKAAISRFAELGFPTTRHEEWKYTNVAPVAKVPFKPARYELNGLTLETLARAGFEALAGARLVFVNGHYSKYLSLLRGLPDGVRAGSLAAALDDYSEWNEPHLAHYAGYQDDAFVALNTSFIRDGAFVYVPKGKVVEEAIHLLFISTTREATVSHPRNLILAGRDSQATIVESYIGLQNAPYFTNAVTEVVLGENAVVGHYKLQRESEQAFHIATVQVCQDRGSNFSSHSIALGGALVRNNVNVTLDGDGGDCALNGLYMAGGQQHVDNHTRVDHLRPHCTSRQLYKGVLDGASRGVFNGKINVHTPAQKTDAKQTNKNLLLSKDAWIDTKPQLEINNNDVKCSHASTIGRLDEDSIFYLRSRGLGPEAARSLLTYAFASEITSRIRIEPIRAQLEELLVTRVQNALQPEDTP